MFSPSVLKLNPRLLTLSRVSERFVVTGGSRLSGEVAVGGAKNSVLKLMAAALLAEGTSTITNCPDILDVPLMAEVLRGLGATVELDGETAGEMADDLAGARPDDRRGLRFARNAVRRGAEDCGSAGADRRNEHGNVGVPF